MGHNDDDLCSMVNVYLTIIRNFFAARNLQLSPTKSEATLSITWTKEVNLELNIFVDGLPKDLGESIVGILSSKRKSAALEVWI